MAAQGELSPRFSGDSFSLVGRRALDVCMALLVVTVGAAGLVTHSWLRAFVESWINIHAIFASLLCGWVILRYQSGARWSPGMPPNDVREVFRRLSRSVYLVLYAVIAARQIICLVSSVGHAGTIDFGLFDERFGNGPDSKVFDPKNDFQVFLASGLVILGILRVTAFRLWLRATERAITVTTSQR
jgi:cytochrome b561